MQIARFFTFEYGGGVFASHAEVAAYENAGSAIGAGQLQEYWQTEDGEVFESGAEAEQHVRDEAISSFDWDGFNMKGVELMGMFA